MITLTNDNDAASSVAQNNQGRDRGLGRVPRSKKGLQSPYKLKTLKILQCNINGLSTRLQELNLAKFWTQQMLMMSRLLLSKKRS
ncbi:hypothetical protein TNCV_661911 [Trichonephila clavipes]|nr:hypothetical protein TNCV_661911 [Trichonephila clavipes]